jgi:cyclin-Q
MDSFVSPVQDPKPIRNAQKPNNTPFRPAPYKRRRSDSSSKEIVENHISITIPDKIISCLLNLHKAGILLRLNPPTICTAIAYYHRCNHKSGERHLLLPQKYSENTIAATCLFLAAKVAETPRRLREVLTTVHRIWDPSKQFLDLNSEYFRLKEELVGCEQLVLRTICFETTYDDRHKLVLHYIHWLNIKTQHPKIAQVAYSLMTDSTYSPFLCHECPKRALAAACIMVAVDIVGKDCSCVMPKGVMPWYAAFGARPLDVMAGYHHLMQLLEQVWRKRDLTKEGKLPIMEERPENQESQNNQASQDSHNFEDQESQDDLKKSKVQESKKRKITK